MTDEEMAAKYRKSIKQKLIDEDEFERLEMFDEQAKEYFVLPEKEKHVNIHNYCLHLFYSA